MRAALFVLVGVVAIWAAVAFTAAPVGPRSFEEALAKSKATGKPLLVIFGAEWCAACHVLEEEVLPDPAVAKALKDFTTVHLDTDKEGKGMAERHSITSLPTLLFIAPDGRIVYRLEGAPTSEGMVELLGAVKHAVARA